MSVNIAYSFKIRTEIKALNRARDAPRHQIPKYKDVDLKTFFSHHRYELIDILKNNGMNTSMVNAEESGMFSFLYELMNIYGTCHSGPRKRLTYMA